MGISDSYKAAVARNTEEMNKRYSNFEKAVAELDRFCVLFLADVEDVNFLRQRGIELHKYFDRYPVPPAIDFAKRNGESVGFYGRVECCVTNSGTHFYRGDGSVDLKEISDNWSPLESLSLGSEATIACESFKRGIGEALASVEKK